MNQSSEPVDNPPKEGKSPATGRASHLIRIALVAILLAPGVVGYHFLSRKPETPSVHPQERKAIETRVLELRRQDYQIVIRTQGPVRAHSQVNLTAQVAGRVTKIHQKFEEGAFFEEGDLLLELDPVDFEVAVVGAEAQLAQAQFNFAEEQSRGTQARLNWEDLGYKEEAGDLVLRKPQLKQARSQLKLAETQLESARRDLVRSKVRAPFSGRVLTRDVGVGQTIGGATSLGVIFATDYSEVRLPVATNALPHLSLPEDFSDPSLEIVLKDGLDETSTVEWKARILRTEGALDEKTLELFAIARVEDPFGVTSGNFPLRVGQPVIADIPGTVLENVLVIPREAVNGLNRIRLVDAAELTLKSSRISPVWSDEENVIIRDSSIEDGTLLAMTPMVHAPDGGKVEILDDEIPFGPDSLALKSTEASATKSSTEND